MKKVSLVILAFVTIMFQFCEKDPAQVKPPVVIVPAEPGKWRQMLDTNNVEIILTASFSIGSKGYTINPQTNEVYEYNANTNKITQKGNFPGPRRQSSATAFAIGNRGYYGLGLGQRSLKEGSQTQWNYIFRVDFWEYDPDNDLWTRKADCSIPPNEAQFDPKQSSFFGAYGIVINGKAYVGSGRDINFSIRRYLYEYDPKTDKWNALVTPTSNAYPPEYSPIVVAFSAGNKGYIGNSTNLWEFDPAAVNKWNPVKPLPQAINQPVLSLGLGNKGYVYGNLTTLNNSTPVMVNYFYEYIPGSNGGSWNPIPEFKGLPRANCPGFVLNNRIYIGFGSDLSASVLTDMWEYMPAP